jgi:PleD family two-component response regulator
MNDERATILIADDDPVNVQLIRLIFKDQYDTLYAADGVEALSMIRENRPDIVLLDIMMPGMSGYDVCRAMKDDPELATIPLIFITALDSTDSEIEGFSSGGLDYITKPIRSHLLRLRVNNHLEMKRYHDLVKRQRDELENKTRELEEALSRVKTLEGIIPICMYCKSIRNDAETWEKLEAYITRHTDALFSHGICPSCMKKYHPDVLEGDE